MPLVRSVPRLRFKGTGEVGGNRWEVAPFPVYDRPGRFQGPGEEVGGNSREVAPFPALGPARTCPGRGPGRWGRNSAPSFGRISVLYPVRGQRSRTN